VRKRATLSTLLPSHGDTCNREMGKGVLAKTTREYLSKRKREKSKGMGILANGKVQGRRKCCQKKRARARESLLVKGRGVYAKTSR